MDAATNERPKRKNAGSRVNYLQMNFASKACDSKREFTLFMNSNEYNNRHKKKNETPSYMKMVTEAIFTQMSAKKGITMFGETEVAAIIKEYTKLDQGTVFQRNLLYKEQIQLH